MDPTTSTARGSRGKPADTADDTTTADTGTTAPREEKLPRAVHELRTGPEPDDKIDGGTIITDELAAEHDLDDAQLEKLFGAGAIELVDVLIR
ncbi:hypothetical protein [Sphingomonas sp. Leaf4]|uniref:hypothetical protein n=1 Tax=Sphingomonas sp. Leaf4 TaxID=2876553 RepID=UPI001E627394|nr:hypothetical protein [Sphingomonas sp. Leaf4]